MDPVQRLLAIAERERRKRALAPVGRTAHREPPAASLDDTARRHQRRQQALIDAVRAGRERQPAVSRAG